MKLRIYSRKCNIFFFKKTCVLIFANLTYVVSFWGMSFPGSCQFSLSSCIGKNVLCLERSITFGFFCNRLAVVELFVTNLWSAEVHLLFWWFFLFLLLLFLIVCLFWWKEHSTMWIENTECYFNFFLFYFKQHCFSVLLIN